MYLYHKGTHYNLCHTVRAEELGDGALRVTVLYCEPIVLCGCDAEKGRCYYREHPVRCCEPYERK